jgi:hypothetical protein
MRNCHSKRLVRCTVTCVRTTKRGSNGSSQELQLALSSLPIPCHIYPSTHNDHVYEYVAKTKRVLVDCLTLYKYKLPANSKESIHIKAEEKSRAQSNAYTKELELIFKHILVSPNLIEIIDIQRTTNAFQIALRNLLKRLGGRDANFRDRYVDDTLRRNCNKYSDNESLLRSKFCPYYQLALCPKAFRHTALVCTYSYVCTGCPKKFNVHLQQYQTERQKLECFTGAYDLYSMHFQTPTTISL